MGHSRTADVDEWIKHIDLDRMIQLRRHFHQNPELSFEEFETAEYIADILHSYGLEVQTEIGNTGIVATLKGDGQGSTIALRADMDALPIQDQKQTEYRSKKDGVMHACGHDGHVSILLETARILSKHRHGIKGTVKFIFQHAEELIPGGAKMIMESGCLDDVDFVFGLHLWSGIESCKIGLCSGPMMASTDHFDILLSGKGGHGAVPHESVDLIYLSSSLIAQFQGIVSRRINPVHPSLISIGSIHGGTTYNVLPGEVQLKGTVRCFDPQSRAMIEQLMHETISCHCSLFGAEYQFRYHKGYPPVVNSIRETEQVQAIFKDEFPAETVFELEPLMVGEDFSYYLEKIPGCFFFIGCRNEEENCVFPHHHGRFDIDEKSMVGGVKAFLGIVDNWCGKIEEGRGNS